MSSDYLKISITIFLAVLGWIIGHHFTEKRARASKKRDLTTSYLIQAFKVLSTEIAHREQSPERELKLENIISEIQLFGSDNQIRYAKDLVDELTRSRKFELDQLINSLRDELRKELGLSEVNGNLKWVRFKEDQSEKLV